LFKKDCELIVKFVEYFYFTMSNKRVPSWWCRPCLFEGDNRKSKDDMLKSEKVCDESLLVEQEQISEMDMGLVFVYDTCSISN